jgi:hypothetical protein
MIAPCRESVAEENMNRIIQSDYPVEDFGSLIVPQGEYFLMGDLKGWRVVERGLPIASMFE